MPDLTLADLPKWNRLFFSQYLINHDLLFLAVVVKTGIEELDIFRHILIIAVRSGKWMSVVVKNYIVRLSICAELTSFKIAPLVTDSSEGPHLSILFCHLNGCGKFLFLVNHQGDKNEIIVDH